MEGSWVFVREMESWEALRDGGPTKRVGAGSRLACVCAVGEDLLGGCKEPAALAAILTAVVMCA